MAALNKNAPKKTAKKAASKKAASKKVPTKAAAPKKAPTKKAAPKKAASKKVAKAIDVAEAERLFLAVYRRNWDLGTAFFVKALEKPECDLGTALVIYWMGRPAYYAKYSAPAEVPAHERPVYALLRKIEARVRAGLPSVIAYAPAEAEVAAARGLVPEVMTQPSTGPRDARALLDGDADAQRLITACASGDLSTVKALDRFDPNVPIGGAFKIAPLIQACSGGHTDIIAWLLDHGGNLQLKAEGRTLLHWACQSGRASAVELLLARGMPVDAKAQWGRTPLHAAVFWPESEWKASHMESVTSVLLRAGASQTARDVDGYTPRVLAERVGNGAAIALLESA